MPNQNLQDIIDSLSRYNIPTSVANDENNDPYTLLGKINLVLKGLIALDEKQGTKVNVAGVFQKLVDFVEDPQDQINKLTDAVALNIEGIAHMNEIKQDKLSQTDLDNIAMLNQLPDKLNAKASKTEVNSLSMVMSDTKDNEIIITNNTPTSLTYLDYNILQNGWVYLLSDKPITCSILKNNKSQYAISGATDPSDNLCYMTIPVFKDYILRVFLTTKPTKFLQNVFIHVKEV